MDRGRAGRGLGWWQGMGPGEAVALRALIPPQVPLHGNTHGIREMRELLVGHDALIPNLLVGQYGYAKHALLSALVALAGSTARALFWINIGLGSLTPLALGLATTLAFRSRFAGLLAALFLACLPAHVGLSSSESGLVAYNLLLAAALVVAQVAVRSGQLRQLLLFGLLVGFTAQLHAVAVAAPCLAFAALMYDPRGSTWRQKPWWKLVATGSFTLALLAPHAMKMMANYWQPGRDRAEIVSLETWSSTSNLLFNAGVTPVLAPLLCLAGLLVWGRSRWLAALIWGGAIVAFSWLHIVICVSFSDAIRYQATPLMLTLPPAAYALARLAGPWEDGILRARPMLAVVAALAVLGSAIPGLRLVSEVHNEALEYAFWRRTIPKLPSKATLVLLDERLAEGKVLTDFPDFLLLEHGKSLDVIRQRELTRRTRRPRGPLILYHGLTCHSFTAQEIRRRTAGGARPLTVRPECSRFRQKYNLRPLVTEQFRSRRLQWSSARSYYFQQIPAETLTVGFYILK